MDTSGLGERKQKILKVVVQQHVETAEPVGSEMIAAQHDLGVRSATIRNEMAELSDLGYLKQPHTSAGRVPSDLGYRFYVDRLMGPAVRSTWNDASTRQLLHSVAAEIDAVIAESCRMLSRLTSYISIATQRASNDVAINHVMLSRVGEGKLLAVVVLSDGHVEHRMLNHSGRLSAADAERISAMVAGYFVGVSLENAVTAGAEPLDPQAHPVCAMAVEAVREIAKSLASEDDDVHVEWTNYVLKHPEFKDVARLERILAALDERRLIYQMLSRTVLGRDVAVIIGSENPYVDMQSTSFVATTYRIGTRTVGTLGVIGPTRMDYRRAISAVNAMAGNLSELLTLLSIS